MKTISVTYYEYKELSKEAQAKAIQIMLQGYEYPYWNEARESLESFVESFGAKIDRYSIYMESSIHTQLSFKMDGNYGEPTIQDAREILKRLEADAKNEKLLTGVWLDETLLEGARKVINKKDIEVLSVLNHASNAWLMDIQSDYEYQTSDEAIMESVEVMDYLFDINGNMAPVEAYN